MEKSQIWQGRDECVLVCGVCMRTLLDVCVCMFSCRILHQLVWEDLTQIRHCLNRDLIAGKDKPKHSGERGFRWKKTTNIRSLRSERTWTNEWLYFPFKISWILSPPNVLLGVTYFWTLYFFCDLIFFSLCNMQVLRFMHVDMLLKFIDFPCCNLFQWKSTASFIHSVADGLLGSFLFVHYKHSCMCLMQKFLFEARLPEPSRHTEKTVIFAQHPGRSWREFGGTSMIIDEKNKFFYIT